MDWLWVKQCFWRGCSVGLSSVRCAVLLCLHSGNATCNCPESAVAGCGSKIVFTWHSEVQESGNDQDDGRRGALETMVW
eukprot:413533-Pelagomonas_calceolata.AAC.1